MHPARSFAAIAAGTALALAGVAAAPSSDTFEVTSDGGTITVNGTLTDGLGDAVIGTDAVGDSTFTGLGADYSEMQVAFPEPGIVAFSTAIGDANPATGHIPHGARFQVPGVTFGSDAFELVAAANADTGLTVAAQSCAPDPDTGVNTCTSTPVDGGYADGKITWLLPTSALPGDQLLAGTAVILPSVSTGTTGGLFLNTSMDDMGISVLSTMPSATLLVDGVALATGALSDAGYTVSASDLAAGTYAVSVELCGALDGDCAIVDAGTVTVTDAS